MRYLFVISTVLVFSSNSYAQSGSPDQLTRDETFQQIGEKLQAIQTDLAKSPSDTQSLDWKTFQSTGFTPASGQTTSSVTVFSEPSPAAPPKTELAPGTKVKALGLQDGYVKIQPMTMGSGAEDYFVTQGVAKTSFKFDPVGTVGNMLSGTVDTTIQDALKKASELAESLEGNPYVNMKGFSVQLTFPPGLNIDFEMK